MNQARKTKKLARLFALLLTIIMIVPYFLCFESLVSYAAEQVSSFINGLKNTTLNAANTGISYDHVYLMPEDGRLMPMIDNEKDSYNVLECAYTSGDTVEFKIYYSPKAGSSAMESDTVVYFRTRDFTAVSEDYTDTDGNKVNRDYTAVNSSVTIKAGSEAGYVTVSVKVNKAPYALMPVQYIHRKVGSHYAFAATPITFTHVTNNNLGNYVVSTSGGVMGTGTRYTRYSEQNSPANILYSRDYIYNGNCESASYLSRYFCIEIYKVEGGAQVAYNRDKSYGAIPSQKILYTRYQYETNGWELDDYSNMIEPKLENVQYLDDTRKTSKYYLCNTSWGKKMSSEIIQTGFGHYYISGKMKIRGEDMFQNDSIVGLIYDGAEKMQNFTSGSESIDPLRNGIAYMEMDGHHKHTATRGCYSGYPVDFAVFNNEMQWKYIYGKWERALSGSYITASYSYDEYSDVEWDENTRLLELYKSYFDYGLIADHYNVYGEHITTESKLSSRWEHGEFRGAAYKVETDAAWVGVIASRDSHGDERRVYDIRLYVMARDDSPITIKQVFLENADDLGLLKTDKWRISVRFNEPVQIRYNNAPTLKVKLQGKEYTFKCIIGGGTDTLVFELNLADLSTDYKVTDVEVFAITNADKIWDFSSADGIVCTKATTAYEDYTIPYYTKADGQRWTLQISYPKSDDGLTYFYNSAHKSITFNFEADNDDCFIDPRKPVISSVICNTSTEVQASHTIYVNLNYSSSNAKVYYQWTQSYNTTLPSTIPLPDSFSYRAIDISGNGSKFQITGEEKGTVFLWLKSINTYGSSDVRLVGPFYFDNDADTISNIAFVTKVGDVWTTDQSQAVSVQPSATKTLEFTISHANDYRSASVYSTSTKRIFDQLSLLYTNDSSWNADNVKTINLLTDSEGFARTILMVPEKTKSITVDKLFYAMSSDVEGSSVGVFTNIFKSYIDGVAQQETYNTEYTYRLTLNCDDFDIPANSYGKYYIGLLPSDVLQNVKKVSDDDFIIGKDCISSYYTYFDRRDIISSSASITAGTNILSSYLGVETDGTRANLADVTGLLVYDGLKTTKVVIDLSEIGGLAKSLLEGSSTELRLTVNKPNAVTSNIVLHAGATYDAYTHLFTTEALNNPSGDALDATWFTWKLLQEATPRAGSEIYYDRIEITFKTYADIQDEIFGFYSISAELLTDKGSDNQKTRYTESFEMYLGAPDNNKQNVTNNTANISSLNEGKMFINTVFRIGTDVKYAYLDTYKGVVSEFYVKNGYLTFSSKEVARQYLTYLEYQDFTLFQIPNDETAISLKEGHGSKIMAEGETTEPAAGQWWICYKRRTWNPSATASTEWVYYYYGVSGESINISAIRGNLSDAVTSVVNNILKKGTEFILTSKDGLDDNGVPVIDENWIRLNYESVATTKNGNKYLSPVSFVGDKGIYDSEVVVTINGKNLTCKTISTQTLSFSKYSYFYMAPLNEDTTVAVYGDVPRGSTALIKNLADVVYGKIVGRSADSVTAPSGVYQCIEIDENGISVQYYYIDKTAPQLNFEFEVWSTDADGYSTLTKANQYFTTQNEVDHSINGYSFTVTGLGKQGAKDATTAAAELDKYAYIAIFDSSKTKLKTAMTVADFNKYGSYQLTEGDYIIEVCDRSGNSYTMPIRLVESKMYVELYTDDYVFFRVDYRSEQDIKEFEVTLNGESLDTTFATSKTYDESGFYTIHIVDWYGMTYNKSFTYQRTIPTVNWLYEEGANFPAITSETLCAVVERENSTNYNVISSVPVGFSYLTTSDIKVEFLNNTAEASDFVIDTSISRYTTYTQKEKKNFQVKFSYKEFPNVYVIYSVYYDKTNPRINVSYQQNSFDYRDETDAILQLKTMLRDGTYFEAGDLIYPTRIDYDLISTSAMNAFSGSVITTQSATISAYDESGIRKMVITLNGETIYAGEYLEDGNYEDGINHNILSDYGEYKITVYDLLNNASEFTFTNDNKSQVTYSVDGVEYQPILDTVYKTDSEGNYLLDEDGQKIPESYWYYVRKFQTTGTEEEELYVDTDVLLDKNSLEHYVRNSTVYTYQQYGNDQMQITVANNADIIYLLTDSQGNQSFLGLTYVDGALYRFVYKIFANDNIADGFSVGNEQEDASIISVDANIKNDVFVYEFADLQIVLTASITSEGVLTLTATDNNTSSEIVTVEARVTFAETDIEPAYFKALLSKRQSDATFYNNEGDIEIGEVGSGEFFYTNGTYLKVNTDNLDAYISEIRVSYSPLGLDFGTTYLVYSVNEIPEELQYAYDDGDGYYCFEVVNCFGNKKVYYFAVSNSLLVDISTIFADGAIWNYSEKDNAVICSNYQITITFAKNNTSYIILKDGKKVNPSADVTTTAITLVLTEAGSYSITINDKNGNRVIKSATIGNASFTLDNNLVYGFNERALKMAEGYTNKKLSVNSEVIASNNIYYMEVSNGNTTTVLLNALNADNYGVLPTENLTECIGLNGDGVYELFVRDRFGNTATRTIHYRETPTLSLSRMTKASQSEMAYDLATAMEVGFYSNSSLYFRSVSTKYVFTVNGIECSCDTLNPKTLNFTTSISEGEIPYEIYYRDEYGNEYFFNAILYRTILSIAPAESVSVITKNGQNYTKNPIAMTWSDNVSFVYYILGENGVKTTYNAGDILRLDGTYQFYAEDYAGNIANYNLTRDTKVEYAFTVGNDGEVLDNGLITTSAETVFTALNNDTAYIVSAFCNGEAVNVAKEGFAKNGKYEVLIADEVGNQTVFTFYVISHEINTFTYPIPNGYKISDIKFTYGNDASVSYNTEIIVENNKSTVTFADEGVYDITYLRDDGLKRLISITISNAAPEAKLENVENGEATTKDINISNVKAGDTVLVYKNGVLTQSYTINFDNEEVTISEEGKYRVVVKNLAGSEIEYSFVRLHVANTAGSLLILVAVAFLAIGVFIGLFYRNRSKVDR